MAIVEIKTQDEKVNEISFVNVMGTGNSTHTHAGVNTTSELRF